MRLRVDGGGYADAASAFETGNHVAALVHDSLAGKLTAYAGMAGHDDSSATFAAAYDDAAADAVGALSDLVAAFGALGHLTTASLANHRDANVASIVGGAHVYEGGALPEDAYASVLAADPPSALGVENTPVLPYPLGLLVEALDGFVWPSADVDRLRDAAHTWRSTAESLDGLTDYCRGAVRGLEPQESPEIPIAIDATRDLERTIDDLADTYLTLAAACEEYAATVDAKRAELVALGHEVLRMIAEEAAISAGLGLLTGGVGGLLKGGAGFARIARHAPRFAAILAALRAAAATTAGTLHTTARTIRASRGRLAKFTNMRLHQRAASHAAASPDRFAQIPRTIGDPRQFNPHELRGMRGADLRHLLHSWDERPALRGSGTVFEDPLRMGRQIRIMDGYPGNRPDPVTHGPYVLVSQNGDKFKIPLEGNPVL